MPHKCCTLWNDHNGAWRKTCQFLRDAAEKERGQPALAAPADNQHVAFQSPHRVDDRVPGIAPAGLQCHRANAETMDAFLRLLQNLVGSCLHRLAEIACRTGQVPELGSCDASANRQENEISAGTLCQDRAGIDGAVCRARAVRGNDDAVHRVGPACHSRQERPGCLSPSSGAFHAGSCRPDPTGIHVIRPSILRCDVTLRLLTLNLWNISEPLEPRYRALAAGLKKLRPEIVCLQEVYRDPKSGRSQAELVAEMCRLNHHVGESGLSIISSQPAVRSVIEPLPQMLDDPPREALLAEFVVETRRLLVINTHLAYQPKMVEGRRKQAGAMLEAIKRHAPKPGDCPKVLCGDFNDVAISRHSPGSQG